MRTMADRERLIELLDGYYSEESTDVAYQFMEGDSTNVATYFTEEERAAYLKGKEEQGRRAMRLLAEMMAISAGAYGMMNYKKNNEED